MKKTLLILPLALAAMTFQAKASDKVLAKVNGKEITESQLNKEISKLPANYRNLKNNKEFRQQMLKNMIDAEILYQQALKEGIDKDPEVLENLELLKKKLYIQALLKKHVKVPQVKVTEKEVREYYEKNKDKFVAPNGKPVPFESLKPIIKQALEQEKRSREAQKAIEAYISKLEKNSKIELLSK